MDEMENKKYYAFFEKNKVVTMTQVNDHNEAYEYEKKTKSTFLAIRLTTLVTIIEGNTAKDTLTAIVNGLSKNF
jgi:hypothetical protein